MLGMFKLDGTHASECVKIGGRALAWSVSSKSWRGRHRYRCASSPIPSGVVKLSPIDGNVVDRGALEERLRSLVGAPRRLRLLGQTLLTGLPRRVTLMLPDLAVRTTVLHLEQFPLRREEQEALIRWRLGQEQRLPLSGAKLTWQVFPPRQPKGLYMVLVVAAQEAILGEYEAACEAAGLLPQEVTVASFRLFDLWLKAAGGARCLDRDLAWVTVSDGGLTCMIFHDGRPVFARTKFLADDEEIGSRESIARIVRETELSILACREHVPDLRLARLVLMTEGDVPALEDELGHALGISTDHLQWEHVQAAGWTHEGGSSSLAMLPVVAGLM